MIFRDFVGDISKPCGRNCQFGQFAIAGRFHDGPRHRLRRSVIAFLTTIRFIRDDKHGAKRISLLAFSDSGAVATAARMLAGEKTLLRSAIDTGKFSFSKLLDYRDPNFLPGAAKYGGLKMMTSLGASSAHQNKASITWLLATQ